MACRESYAAGRWRPLHRAGAARSQPARPHEGPPCGLEPGAGFPDRAEGLQCVGDAGNPGLGLRCREFPVPVAPSPGYRDLYRNARQ